MQDLETYLVEQNGVFSIKVEHLAKLKELKGQKAKVDKELKELTDNITKELKTHFNDTHRVDDFNFVVKGGFYTFDFDFETFKKENYELYLKYLTPKENKESYSLVSATQNREKE